MKGGSKPWGRHEEHAGTLSSLPKKAKALTHENIHRTPKQPDNLTLNLDSMDIPGPSSSSLSRTDFDEYNAQLQAVALKATRLSAALPSDLSFYRSVDKALAKDVDSCKAKVLSVTNKLLHLASTNNSSEARARKRPRLENEDDITDDFHGTIVDLMDQLLEKSDMRIDDFLGVSKVPPSVVDAQNQTQARAQKKVPQGRLDPALQHASRLPKPQLNFTRRVDNRNLVPWRHTLKHKYNAQVPLGYHWQPEDSESTSTIVPSHPYYYEIKRIKYPTRMFLPADPIPPKSFDDTPFAWVDTPAAFNTMLESLRSAKEIAVDLEYHSYRTFAGFVCLMQISSREGDWVIDTLAVRDVLEELNEVFTDPNIVKVFHGAESDIVWLQQDFNLYVVNLFDTYHASKVLDFPRHGLAALLEMYCDFTPDKRFQLADWRIRPLPQEMLDYARSDTHYLLFIYDNLRNALLDRSQSRSQSRIASPSGQDDVQTPVPPPSPDSMLRDVLSRSEDTALRVYEKEVYDAETGQGPGGWDTLAKKWNKSLSGGQDGAKRMEAYKRIHGWRDRVAREEDESTRYVLPNHYVFLLSERPPNDLAALLAMFSSVPPVIRRRAKELMDEIRAATQSQTTPDAPMEVSSVNEEPQVSSSDVKALDTGSSIQPATSLSASQSQSLFGAATTGTRTKPLTRALSAQRSLLLGKIPDNRKPQSLSRQNSAIFQDIVVRIHKNLVITPPSTQNASFPSSTVDVDVKPENSTGPENQVVQAEIPFVPSNLRRKEASPPPDSIVTVGQSQQRKRKRKAKRPLLAGTGDNVQDDIKEEEEEELNILDAGSDHEQEGTKKRKVRIPANFTGNFKAPPKDQSSLRAGNQSHTFR
ncbi:hypothetical protein QCA50_020668 [Cerrena zonata]|uniref:HRDC domain-containing protein n=1 Tax=Cerrena zonata TaxID=2478898 RepID=A0AAW0FB84_9APHY